MLYRYIPLEFESQIDQDKQEIAQLFAESLKGQLQVFFDCPYRYAQLLCNLLVGN